MSYLADLIVVIHLAFIAFAAVGGFAVRRWRRVLYVHLPALAWASYIGITGNLCPLTPLENYLRELAGDTPYSEGFIEHYILPVLYPVGLTRETQWILAALLVALNLIAYWPMLTRRRARTAAENRTRPG